MLCAKLEEGERESNDEETEKEETLRRLVCFSSVLFRADNFVEEVQNFENTDVTRANFQKPC